MLKLRHPVSLLLITLLVLLGVLRTFSTPAPVGADAPDVVFSAVRAEAVLADLLHEGRPHVVDLIKNQDIRLLINTSAGQQAIRDSFSLRREALMAKLPYYTTVAGARSLVEGLRRLAQGELSVAPLQSYTAGVN